MFDRATREWRTSPTIQMEQPSSAPSRERSVWTSRSACVGCSCLPSPALTIAASVHVDTSEAAPAHGVRITIASGLWADSVRTVSFSDSPFSTLEPLAAKFTTSALRRLAASSKLERVRVEAS
jgi:hypothetical protein